MKNQTLQDEEKVILLKLARRTVEAAARRNALPEVKLAEYSASLQEPGASFVTLTINNNLRGCIGALEAYQPLVKDVITHAAAAATEDYRFSPVSLEEVYLLKIEISVLTKPEVLTYSTAVDLMNALIPGKMGVILKDGHRRATFLPQVWEQLPDKQEFLSHLCQKMGAPGHLWKTKNLEVFTYQVEEFHE